MYIWIILNFVKISKNFNLGEKMKKLLLELELKRIKWTFRNNLTPLWARNESKRTLSSEFQSPSRQWWQAPKVGHFNGFSRWKSRFVWLQDKMNFVCEKSPLLPSSLLIQLIVCCISDVPIFSLNLQKKLKVLQCFFQMLIDDCLTTAWWQPDDCLTTAWRLPDDSLITAWRLPDNWRRLLDACLKLLDKYLYLMTA